MAWRMYALYRVPSSFNCYQLAHVLLAVFELTQCFNGLELVIYLSHELAILITK